MPRSRRAAANGGSHIPTAPKGHNGAKVPLTEDEAGALTVYYELKIIEDQRKVEAKKVELDGLREVVNGHFKRMTADLGFTRKEFDAEVIVKGKMTETEYLNSEARRDRLHRLSGRQPGQQIDLIDEVLKDTVDEALQAEHDGYRAGRRADDPVPPTTLSTIFHQDFMRGWHAGQAFNTLQLGKAAEVLARPKPGEMAAAPDEDAEDEDPADPEVIKAKAAKLKKDGWAEPTPAETQFAAE